jgi:peptide/nickel transport system permease protein
MNTRPNPWLMMLGRRLLQVVALALIIGTLCFLMVRSLPGDLATRIAAGRYGYDLVSNAAADAVRIELGLNHPAWLALLHWLRDMATLNLGQSLVTQRAVWHEITHHLGATLRLSAGALAVAVALGVPLGLWSGLRPGGWVDRLTWVLSVVLRAVPPFLLAVLLMLLVAVQWGFLPVAGDDNQASMVLPALTLGLGLAAGLARVTRAAMRDVVESPSFEFARTKGLTDLQALVRHGLRNTAVPVAAYLGVQALFLVEGAVVVETLFAWPGIGHALVHAVFGRDIPMIQGTALCMGLIFISFNLLMDTACLALDPRHAKGVSA